MYSVQCTVYSVQCTVLDIYELFIPSLHARSLCGEVRGRVMAEQSVAHVTHTARPALWARWYLWVGVQVCVVRHRYCDCTCLATQCWQYTRPQCLQ